MSDQQKAAQMLMVYYENPEFSLEHEYGGVLLSANAFKNIKELKKDLKQLQANSKNRVFVAVDHEGGRVNRLKHLKGWDTTLSAEQLGKLTPIEILAHAERAAVLLSDIGINMNLAPVLDPLLSEDRKVTWIGQNNRSFGNENQIIDAASSYISGFEKYGIVSITKHFPGYLSLIDSDKTTADVDSSSGFIESSSKPFYKLANVSGGTMMANHAYKTGGGPAALSSDLVVKAREVYPSGLILTDDLWVDGIRLWGQESSSSNLITKTKDRQLLAVTKQAIKAGNDILLITYPEKAVLMKNEIAKWMKQDQSIKQNVDKAVNRILKFKTKHYQ